MLYEKGASLEDSIACALSLAPIGSNKAFWPPCPRCHRLHSNYMLNRGYAYTAIISSKNPGQTLLSHLAGLTSTQAHKPGNKN